MHKIASKILCIFERHIIIGYIEICIVIAEIIAQDFVEYFNVYNFIFPLLSSQLTGDLILAFGSYQFAEGMSTKRKVYVCKICDHAVV